MYVGQIVYLKYPIVIYSILSFNRVTHVNIKYLTLVQFYIFNKLSNNNNTPTRFWKFSNLHN
jgi:hypothetical protein